MLCKRTQAAIYSLYFVGNLIKLFVHMRDLICKLLYVADFIVLQEDKNSRLRLQIPDFLPTGFQIVPLAMLFIMSTSDGSLVLCSGRSRQPENGLLDRIT